MPDHRYPCSFDIFSTLCFSAAAFSNGNYWIAFGSRLHPFQESFGKEQEKTQLYCNLLAATLGQYIINFVIKYEIRSNDTHDARRKERWR
jgi:hypothetical protein